MRARDVVVATNAWATDWRPVRGRLTVFGSYVVLTEPVPDLLREIGWTDGVAIFDARMFLHYFRTTDDGRVLMGSGSGPIGYGNRIDEVDYLPQYHDLMRTAVQHGLHGAPWTDDRVGSHVARAASAPGALGAEEKTLAQALGRRVAALAVVLSAAPSAARRE